MSINKVKITADAVLDIVRGVLYDEDVDTVIDDSDAPDEWKGRRICDVLNVEYYAYKHRAVTTEQMQGAMQPGVALDRLAGTKRAFGLMRLVNTERLFSKDVDMVTVEASLEYYMQTSKLELLGLLIENANIATCGLRIPVKFGSDEMRRVIVMFGSPEPIDYKTASEIGESAAVSVGVKLLFCPDTIGYSDYNVSFTFSETENGVPTEKTVSVPLSGFSMASTMTQDAVPLMNDSRKVGNINLSCASSFVLVFDGRADNAFVEHVTSRSLAAEVDNAGNNEAYTMRIERNGKTYVHRVVVKSHQISVNADTGNETHTLSLTSAGLVQS